jgi:hypothetical protein
MPFSGLVLGFFEIFYPVALFDTLLCHNKDMIDAILFPCNMGSMNDVDWSFEDEYSAARECDGYELFFYDYDQFVRDGRLILDHQPEKPTLTVLRGWMLNDKQYELFYNQLLSRNIKLITNPEQYNTMHLFPNVYPMIAEDTPEILIYPDGAEIDVEYIKSKFKRFLVKDYVKSEKGTDFPKSFDHTITQENMDQWLKVFREYRGKLFTGGICIKEYVELKKYGERTNEWRVFYIGGHVLSVSKNSGQMDFINEVPQPLVGKYMNLPSPFYTVDFAELADGSWKILEAGDGQVSGLSDNQNARAFFRALWIGL